MAAAPDYPGGSLASVLPSVVHALGCPDEAGRPLLPLPDAARAVVVLLDGLGDHQLRRRTGHAPFLRRWLDTAHQLSCGFPSTTATSMGSFGTGLPPGAHGLVGYEVMVPGEDRVFNELSWQDGPNPQAWQPMPTVFEQVSAGGVAVTRIGPAFFDGSGLTRAALRGGRFEAAVALSDRVDAALAAVRRSRRALVYLYWGDIDTIGHVHGWESMAWGEELQRTDAELARLARSLPPDTALFVTADHGMVDSPHESRIDLVVEPELLAGVRHVGGEPRSVQLYGEPGETEHIATRWRTRLGTEAIVLTRDDVIAQGWFGEVSPRVRPRIGDVVVNLLGDRAVVDSQRMRPQLLALRGLHGSVTDDEVRIPLIVVPPGG